MLNRHNKPLQIMIWNTVSALPEAGCLASVKQTSMRYNIGSKAVEH